LEYYDARIEELGQDLVDAKMRTESIRVTAALEKALDELDPNLPPKHRETLVRTFLNEASNYLVQLRRIYFDQNYCELSKRLQPEFLKTRVETCDDRHLLVYRKLRDARSQVAERFDQLAKTVANVEEAHLLIDRFIQIEFELTEDRVGAAKKLVREAKETMEDAREFLEKTGRPGA
jgi:hypothetical protein